MRPAPPAPALLVLAALLLAGCAASPARVAPPDLLPHLLPPVAVSKTDPGAEPVVALAPDGTLYSEGVGRADRPPSQVGQNVNKIFRSTDNGSTWSDITPPFEGQERSNDGFVAVGPNGDVYAANAFSLTLEVLKSTDKGASWTPLNVPRLPLLMHRHWIIPLNNTVHIVVEAFPPSYATFLAGLAPPMAQTGVPNEGMWYFRSDDGGLTWSMPQQIDARVNFAGQSELVASPDGKHLYVVRYTEPGKDPTAYTYASGQWYLLASDDGGNTWQKRDMFPVTAELSTALPSLARDTNGTLYVAWTMAAHGTSRLHLAASHDEGKTWSAPQELAVPSPGVHAMAWIAARAPGELEAMWYAADVDGIAQKVNTSWFVDYADITGADTAQPAVHRSRVTPEEIHHGNICAKGPACQQGEDRRLLDYPWLVVAPDGTPRMVWASTKWEHPGAFMMFARGV